MRIYKAAMAMTSKGYKNSACGICNNSLIAVAVHTALLDGSAFKVAYCSNGSDSRGATKIKVDLFVRKGKGKFKLVRSNYGALSPFWADDSKEAIALALETASYVEEEETDSLKDMSWLRDSLEYEAMRLQG